LRRHNAFYELKNRQPLYFEQAVDLCRYYHKTVNHPYSVVWSPFHCVYASCICALESLILYVQLKPFWRSHRFIQFARLVFEIESYRRNLSTTRTTGEWLRCNRLFWHYAMCVSAESAAAILLQRCIPVNGHGHRAEEFVSI